MMFLQDNMPLSTGAGLSEIEVRFRVIGLCEIEVSFRVVGQ